MTAVNYIESYEINWNELRNCASLVLFLGQSTGYGRIPRRKGRVESISM